MNGALTIQNPKGTGDELPPGTVGDPYSTNLTASGGSGVYRWELINRSSALSWLTLNKDTGVLSGQPDAATAGAVSLTFNVTDANSVTAQRALLLTINPRVSGNGRPPVLTIQAAGGDGGELPPGMVGEPYSTTFTAAGGSGGYSWELLNPYGMPSGLNLDKDTGILSGLPDAAAAVETSLTLKVTDSDNATAQRAFSIEINPALRISGSTGLADGGILLNATGGTSPYTWKKVSGFPDWFELSQQGAITIAANANLTGIKTTQLTVSVTDNASHPHTAQASFSATVRRASLWRQPRRRIKTAGLDIKFRPNRQLSLARLSQLTFWLGVLALGGPILGIIPVFVYALTTPGTPGTYLGVGLLTALAAFLAGCLTGFLFGIPRVVSSGQARLGTSSDYSPSSNLAEVSDWLTKLLLGAGLVQLTHLGAPISHLIDHVAAGLHTTPAYSGPATVMAGAIIFGYVTIGLLDGYVVTTIWYQKKLASLNI
jgi:Putative Ig domain